MAPWKVTITPSTIASGQAKGATGGIRGILATQLLVSSGTQAPRIDR